VKSKRAKKLTADRVIMTYFATSWPDFATEEIVHLLPTYKLHPLQCLNFHQYSTSSVDSMIAASRTLQAVLLARISRVLSLSTLHMPTN
jgi:hypothetical protein